ncbi:hypothetical protein ACWC5I_28090 [Kitasatospora sp. NPDC001574]
MLVGVLQGRDADELVHERGGTLVHGPVHGHLHDLVDVAGDRGGERAVVRDVGVCGQELVGDVQQPGPVDAQDHAASAVPDRALCG